MSVKHPHAHAAPHADASEAPGSAKPAHRRARSPLATDAHSGARDFWLLYVLYPVLLATAILLCSVRPVSEPDAWFHMTFGRYVLTHHALPAGDDFSYTGAGHEWISTGWGASVLQHYLYEKFNCAGLAYMVFALVAAAYLTVYFVAVRRYANRGSILLVLLAGVLASSLRFSPRPELWSHLGATLVLLLLVTAEDSQSARQGRLPRRLWLLPPLFTLWANLHGGFFLGFVPLGAYGAWKVVESLRARQWRPLLCLVPLALCLVSWMVNPYGPRILILLGQVKDAPTIKTHIIEWMPLLGGGRQLLLPWPTYLGVALGVGFCLWTLAAKRWRIVPWQMAILALFIFLEFQARRHVAVASLVAAVVLTPHLGKLDSLLVRSRALLPSLALAAVFGIGCLKQNNALGLGKGLFITGCETTVLPAISTEYLRRNPPPGNIFNSYGAGGYLMYFLGPEFKVFIDGRFYVYDPQVWEDFIATQDGEMSIDQVCQRYQIKSFLIYTRDNAQSPGHLASRLSARNDFKLVYFSDSYAIFVKDTPETRSYLEGREFKHVSPFVPDRLQKALASDTTRGEAQREIERALELSMGSANATALAALAQYLGGNVQNARQLYATAAGRDPESIAVRHVAQQMF